MKRKKILHRLSLCACLIMTLLMISCDGSQFEMENLFPNEYHKVLSLKDTGEKLLTVSSTSSVPLVEEVHVYKTGSVAYYEAKANPMPVPETISFPSRYWTKALKIFSRISIGTIFPSLLIEIVNTSFFSSTDKWR